MDIPAIGPTPRYIFIFSYKYRGRERARARYTRETAGVRRVRGPSGSILETTRRRADASTMHVTADLSPRGAFFSGRRFDQQWPSDCRLLAIPRRRFVRVVEFGVWRDRRSFAGCSQKTFIKCNTTLNIAQVPFTRYKITNMVYSK